MNFVVLLFNLFLLLPAFLEAAVVKHHFVVGYLTGAPDGVSHPKILGINGEFPGPAITARVGDTLEITVVNDIQDGQNTTLHWHGISQKGSLFEDGASTVTQCPIPPGAHQLYRFNVTQHGTHWYHSHVRSQYTAGLFGPLIVHADNEAYPYVAEATLILSDWYHQTAEENEEWFLGPGNHTSPYPNSGLINGNGRYPCPLVQIQNRTCLENLQHRHVYTVQKEHTHRLRFINSASFASFNISVDGHRLEVIELDGIDVASPPPTVDIISIAPGQRYSVLVTPVNTGRFLIRASIRREHMRMDGENINKYPEALIGNLTAVLNVVDEDLNGQVVESKEQFGYSENVPSPVYQSPGEITLLDEMDLSSLDGIPATDPWTKEFTIHTGVVEIEGGFLRAALNDTPFQAPDHKPMIISFLEDGLLPNGTLVLEVEYGDVVQLVLNNPQPEPHPFHLHGHHFWVMGLGKVGDGGYQSGYHNLTLRGPKRDTVVVQEDSWMVIRFVADNPGIWAFHCHVDWHNLAGMALVIVEAGDVLTEQVGVTQEASRVCSLHNNRSKLFA